MDLQREIAAPPLAQFTYFVFIFQFVVLSFLFLFLTSTLYIRKLNCVLIDALKKSVFLVFTMKISVLSLTGSFYDLCYK